MCPSSDQLFVVPAQNCHAHTNFGTIAVAVLCCLLPGFAGESLLHFAKGWAWVCACVDPVNFRQGTISTGSQGQSLLSKDLSPCSNGNRSSCFQQRQPMHEPHNLAQRVLQIFALEFEPRSELTQRDLQSRQGGNAEWSWCTRS